MTDQTYVVQWWVTPELLARTHDPRLVVLLALRQTLRHGPVAPPPEGWSPTDDVVAGFVHVPADPADVFAQWPRHRFDGVRVAGVDAAVATARELLDDPPESGAFLVRLEARWVRP